MTDRSRLYLVIFLSTLLNTAFMGCRVGVPLLAIELEASTMTVGVLMSLFGLLPMLLSVHAGRWIDAVGAGIPMIVSAGAMALALLLAFVQPELWVLFPLAAVTGLAFIAFNLAATAIVGGLGGPADRTANFSWLSVAGGISNFAGAVITGHMIDAIGHAPAFAVLALLPALVAAVIVMVRYAHPPRPRAPRRASSQKLLELLRQPGLLPLLIIAGAIGMSWDLYNFMIPVYGSAIGLSAGSIGNVMGAFGLSVLLVRVLLPMLARLMGEWQMVLAAIYLSAAVFVAFPFGNAPAVLMVLSFLFGIAFGAAQPIITALLFNASPSGREGEVMGVRMTLHNAVHASTPALFGVLSGILGLLPLFLGIGALLAGVGWISKVRWSKDRSRLRTRK